MRHPRLEGSFRVGAGDVSVEDRVDWEWHEAWGPGQGSECSGIRGGAEEHARGRRGQWEAPERWGDPQKNVALQQLREEKSHKGKLRQLS